MKKDLAWDQMDPCCLLAGEIARQYQEILQLVNQRFQLVTITVVGTITILVWAVAELIPHSSFLTEPT